MPGLRKLLSDFFTPLIDHRASHRWQAAGFFNGLGVGQAFLVDAAGSDLAELRKIYRHAALLFQLSFNARAIVGIEVMRARQSAGF